MKQIIKKLIIEAWETKREYVGRRIIPKEMILSDSSAILVGPRRAGKSYTMYQMIDEYFEGRKDKQGYVFLNFEDERISGFKKNQFDLILESFYELKQDSKPVIFLDEVQNIPGWEKYVRRLSDSGHKVVVSGSNSEMLSQNIAQKLGGRFIQFAIYPLSFSEFLKFKNYKIPEKEILGKKRYEVLRYFEEYLEYGGFPEVSRFDRKESKRKVLQTYYNLVFYKDLISNKSLENEQALHFIIKKIRENIGKVFSNRSVYASLKKADIQVGPNTVEKYIEELFRAFLINPCFPFNKSVLAQSKEKKYFVDNGYLKLLEIKEDWSLLLENLVFLEILKRGGKAFYFREKRECDFIVGNCAVQVAYELNDGNREREMEGVIEAIEKNKLERGIVLTYNSEESIETGGKEIKVMPAWKWCLFGS